MSVVPDRCPLCGMGVTRTENYPARPCYLCEGRMPMKDAVVLGIRMGIAASALAVTRFGGYGGPEDRAAVIRALSPEAVYLEAV